MGKARYYITDDEQVQFITRLKILEGFLEAPVKAPVELTETESKIIRSLRNNELSILEISDYSKSHNYLDYMTFPYS